MQPKRKRSDNAGWEPRPKIAQDPRTPAERDATTHAHYDSTVDNEQNPNIFVTYNDAQAYPEYLIKFKQDGNPPSHPTTGKLAPPDYRPNVFSDCYD